MEDKTLSFDHILWYHYHGSPTVRRFLLAPYILMERPILGLTGPKGSGKGTIAKYLERRYGASIVAFSDTLNEILELLAIEKTRVNQIDLALALRETFGKDVIGRAVAARIQTLPGRKLVIIDGIRYPEDIAHWRSRQNFHLISVTADSKTRYERIRKRGKTKEEFTLTYKQFLREETLPTEQNFNKLFKTARFTIHTDGSLMEVYDQVDQIAKTLTIKPLRT